MNFASNQEINFFGKTTAGNTLNSGKCFCVHGYKRLICQKILIGCQPKF